MVSGVRRRCQMSVEGCQMGVQWMNVRIGLQGRISRPAVRGGGEEAQRAHMGGGHA